MRQGRKTTIKLFLAFKKSVFGGWGEVSAAKGAAIQASGPAFDPWDGQPLGFSMKQKKRWDPEMAQLVKALTIISKDQSSIPGTRGRRELTSDLHKHTMVLCPCVCAHTGESPRRPELQFSWGYR